MKRIISILTLTVSLLFLMSNLSDAQTKYRTLRIDIEGEGLVWLYNNVEKTKIEVTIPETQDQIDLEFSTINKTTSYTFAYNVLRVYGATCDKSLPIATYLQGPSGYYSEYISFKNFDPSNVITLCCERDPIGEFNIQWWLTTPANPAN